MMPPSQFKGIKGLALRQIEAEKLIDLYTTFGLVGVRDAIVNKEEFSRKVTPDPIAVACCRILNDFRPLDHIVRSVFAASNSRDRKRYLIVALAQYCFRGGVRYEILAAISGGEGWREQFDLPHPLPLAYLENSDENYIVTLNATLGDRILDLAAKDHPALIFDCFVGLGNALAPRVNRDAIRRRTPEARLAGRLFDYDAIVSAYLHDQALQFYQTTQKAWQWNSRYWEQVALLYLSRYQASPLALEGKEALRQSIQHARHAVSIEAHPFPLTTLGKILLARLQDDGIPKSETYYQAFGFLSRAIYMERAWNRPTVQPFITLFRGSRDFVGRGGILTSAQTARLRGFATEARANFPDDKEVLQEISEVETIVLQKLARTSPVGTKST